jgi:hypothetical protein
MRSLAKFEYVAAIDRICGLGWGRLTADECVDLAWAYYYFSIQFRENLQIARELYPDDAKLMQLEREECDTSNLSPWPGVAAEGERMNHDEFMRRLLELAPVAPERRAMLERHGERYLREARAATPLACAQSIASYEDGGLEQVFTAMLQAPLDAGPLHLAFHHFLSEHIRFDSDPLQGHGALSRHIVPDDRIRPLWEGFETMLLACVPGLSA